MENRDLVINVIWPHLGASPVGIGFCDSDCCERRAVEIKSLFAKRNLHSHIAAAEYISKVNGQYTLKGELATTGYKVANLIIYPDKGILVIYFDDSCWKTILHNSLVLRLYCSSVVDLKKLVISYAVNGLKVKLWSYTIHIRRKL